ncbi:hypothetical protein V5P93_002534 [Actinokineospora auranticolor]|uniref:Type VII secretion system (Wss) protein ESAT-6 n=1 Tax=Actinokineospora auranticolor TaxID=155976 RepID=A0A2S6GMP5_9PSEU|nr:hypothetical protein [Actinokineospora auranticolor]PPK66436.1 hypothetical protein CLV40_110140 [Actinokineospora auranticolor]
MRDSDGGGGSIAPDVSNFLGSAQSGGFAVNERGGQALLTAIDNMTSWIDDNVVGWEKLAREPKLGSTNNAQVMKPFMVAVASDDRGFITQMSALRESLLSAREAIVAAIANYKNTEARAMSSYTQT